MLENEVCSVDITSLDRMCIDSIELVKYARESAMKQVNVIQTMTYYCIGKWIVEEQQKGEKRAKYGKQILKQLSETLNLEEVFQLIHLRICESFILYIKIEFPRTFIGISLLKNPRRLLGFWMMRNHLRCHGHIM